MTPPVFLSPLAAGEEPVVVLDGPEGRHAATVRRVRPGERLDLVDGLGARAECRVSAVLGDALRLDVVRRHVEPPPSPRVVAVQALAKGDAGEGAVTAMTEVGVDEVVPWQSSRSIVKWDGERGEKALSRWRSAAREAGKQSRRATFAVVAPAVGLTELLARVRASAVTLVLHEGATQPLAALDLPSTGDLLVVIGPEGGIADDELAQLVGAGALVVRMGSSVLRSATAGTAAVAVVLARCGRWT